MEYFRICVLILWIIIFLYLNKHVAYVNITMFSVFAGYNSVVLLFYAD